MHVCAGSEYIVCTTCKLPHFRIAFRKLNSINKCLIDPTHHLAYVLFDNTTSTDEFDMINFEKCFLCGEGNDFSESVWCCLICNSYFICSKCIILSKLFTEENPRCPNDDGERLIQTYENYGHEHLFICLLCHLSKDCSYGRRVCQKCNLSICPQCLPLPDFQQCSICLEYSFLPQKLNCIHDFKICKNCSVNYPKLSQCPYCLETGKSRIHK